MHSGEAYCPSCKCALVWLPGDSHAGFSHSCAEQVGIQSYTVQFWRPHCEEVCRASGVHSFICRTKVAWSPTQPVLRGGLTPSTHTGEYRRLQLDFVWLPDFLQLGAWDPRLFYGERCVSLVTISVRHLSYGAFYFTLCKDLLSEVTKSRRTFGELSELTVLCI